MKPLNLFETWDTTHPATQSHVLEHPQHSDILRSEPKLSCSFRFQTQNGAKISWQWMFETCSVRCQGTLAPVYFVPDYFEVWHPRCCC